MRKAKPVILLLASVSVLLRASKVATVKSKSSLMEILIKQGSKKVEFQLVPWVSSPHVFLVRDHFLLFSVNDFVRG